MVFVSEAVSLEHDVLMCLCIWDPCSRDSSMTRSARRFSPHNYSSAVCLCVWMYLSWVTLSSRLTHDPLGTESLPRPRLTPLMCRVISVSTRAGSVELRMTQQDGRDSSAHESRTTTCSVIKCLDFFDTKCTHIIFML